MSFKKKTLGIFVTIFSLFALVKSNPVETLNTENIKQNSYTGQNLRERQPTKISYVHPYWERFGEFDGTTCNLNKKLKSEILEYQEVVDQIMQTVVNGSFKGETLKHLAHFTDFFGSRLPGSISHEKAIAFLTRQLVNIPTLVGSVYSDDVEIPSWQRGNESAEITAPIKKSIPVKGMALGSSTSPEGVEAEVIVVDSIEDLKSKRQEVLGRIIVFNVNFEESLLPIVPKAAALGAVAVLMRSPTPFSIYSMHATTVQYGDFGKRIPCGTLTVEDAELLYRLYKKGKTITLKLILQSNSAGGTAKLTSQNIIVEFEGREYNDEFVVISAHSDSLDIGQGALDGTGAIMTYEAARLFDDLKLYPKRTVRAAIWTGTKYGNLGVRNFLNIHDIELTSKYSAAIGADLGCLKAMGYIFSGSKEAACVIYDILQLFPDPIGRSLIHVNGTTSDTSWFTYPNGGTGVRPAGIPSLTLNGDDGHLSWYADSVGDTVSILESEQLDLCLGIYTSLAYIIADLDDPLPLY